MKLSLKFREETQHKNPLLRVKIPVTVLGLPFLSGVVAGDSTDLSFSLRSNFSSGPTLSLSYHPTTSTTSFPFAISLKSGIGLFGSPHNSPLVFTANFNLFSTSSISNPNSITPIFSLQIKPQLGNFSLFKSVDSNSCSPIRLDGHPPNGELSDGSSSDFDVVNGSGHMLEKPLAWGDLKRQSSILSGIFVAARTSMPLTKKAMLNFRWGVNFPPGGKVLGGSKKTTPLPVLVVNKISLERVDVLKKVEEEKKNEVAKAGELELLKGMCSWMRSEMEELQRENREIKHALDGMRLRGPGTSRGRGWEREAAAKRGVDLNGAEGMTEFDKWRSKKSGGAVEENGHKESKKSPNRMNEVENELQKAIKAASS